MATHPSGRLLFGSGFICFHVVLLLLPLAFLLPPPHVEGADYAYLGVRGGNESDTLSIVPPLGGHVEIESYPDMSQAKASLSLLKQNTNTTKNSFSSNLSTMSRLSSNFSTAHDDSYLSAKEVSLEALDRASSMLSSLESSNSSLSSISALLSNFGTRLSAAEAATTTTTTTTTTSTTTTSTTTPYLKTNDGWTVFGTGLYLPISNAASHQDAGFICASFKGILASASTIEENTFLGGFGVTVFSGTPFYLGGIVNANKTSFDWLDTSSNLYSNWGPSEPYVANGAIVLNTSSSTFKWFTSTSSVTRPYICEKGYQDIILLAGQQISSNSSLKMAEKIEATTSQIVSTIYTDLTIARISPAVGFDFVEGRLYAAGGVGNGVSNQVESFRLTQTSWENVAMLNNYRNFASGVVYMTPQGPNFVVVGGLNGANTVLQTCEVISWSVDGQYSVNSFPSLGNSRYAGAAVLWRGLPVYLGGKSDIPPSSTRSTVYVYNTTSSTWGSLPSMNASRSHFGATVLFDKIIVAGGYNNQGSMNLVEILLPGAPAWGSLPMLRHVSGPCVMGSLLGGLVVLGGESTTNVDYMDPLTAQTPTWYVNTPASLYASTSRRFFSLVNVPALV